MKSPDPVVVVATARTPIAVFCGRLRELSCPQLGAIAIEAIMTRSGLPTGCVSEVLMGCALSAGVGQAPARQAALMAGLPNTVPCTTISKVCGSGMSAVMLGHDLLMAESARVIVAGGMESVSNAPYLLERAHDPARLGHQRVRDHVVIDGLEDAYEQGRLIESFAEEVAERYRFTRESQDDFALCSLERARAAIEDGYFAAEVTPVILETAGPVTMDELPAQTREDKMLSLEPVFKPNGTITAASSSSISDGAAALMLMRASEAARVGAKPLAVIRGHASHAQAPAQFPTAPVGAIVRVLNKVGWQATDVDLFEIDEAFAAVVMAVRQELDLPDDKVNVHGGACALGHPIGASGARILVTLIAALGTYGLKRGVAAIGIGGGEATAIAIERL